MTEEKVKQGEELLKKLGRLKDQKSKWEIAVCFNKIELADEEEYSSSQRTFYVNESFINFEEVRLLALAKIEKRINEVQEEFDKL